MFFALLTQLAVADEVLPVQRVRFYETGVAYFERSGTVSGGTTLPVPRSHLDDALKTLVVLGADSEVGVISFPAAVSPDAARVRAGLGEQSHMGFREALDQIREDFTRGSKVGGIEGDALQGGEVHSFI